MKGGQEDHVYGYTAYMALKKSISTEIVSASKSQRKVVISMREL